jgi:hypothetical protein
VAVRVLDSLHLRGLHGRNGIAHERVEGVGEPLAVPALEHERLDLERQAGVGVADLGLDVGNLGAGGEHQADVGAPEGVA